MRKYVIIATLIILLLICFLLVLCGLKPLKIYSYSDIKKARNTQIDLINEVNVKDVQNFSTKKSSLDEVVKKYNTNKNEYVKLKNEGKITENSDNLFEMEKLKTQIGNSAIENNVTLNLEFVKSDDSVSLDSNCEKCNLIFEVTGEYIDITNFVYSLEDDDSLKFEISNFKLESSENKLNSKFIVKNIPIKKVGA